MRNKNLFFFSWYNLYYTMKKQTEIINRLSRIESMLKLLLSQNDKMRNAIHTITPLTDKNKMSCACGGSYSKSGKSGHRKTLRHLEYADRMYRHFTEYCINCENSRTVILDNMDKIECNFCVCLKCLKPYSICHCLTQTEKNIKMKINDVNDVNEVNEIINAPAPSYQPEQEPKNNVLNCDQCKNTGIQYQDGNMTIFCMCENGLKLKQ